MNKDEYPIEEELEKFMQLSNKLLQENKQLQARIDKAIKLLENSQLYCARAIGKTLFAEVMNKEIEILKGEDND